MRIIEISIAVGIFVFLRFLKNNEIRKWLLFIFSIVSVYWFQTLSSIRYLDFWLPNIAFLLTILVWGSVFNYKRLLQQENLYPLLVLMIIPIGLWIINLLLPNLLDSITSFPPFHALLIACLIAFLLSSIFFKTNIKNQIRNVILISMLLFFFLLIKNNSLSFRVSRFLRKVNRQSLNLASSTELFWVGYSYLAFRLLHVLFERNRLSRVELNLKDYFTYLFFPPTWIAGPIDTIFHFTSDLNKQTPNPIEDDFIAGGKRIFSGLFKKFVIADSLAIFALNEHLAVQIKEPFWMWIAIFAFSFRLLFDFSGYTDIAIGVSQFIGMSLPENFDIPYRSGNLSIFWNRWHMTLTRWFRTYIFNPLTRLLRTEYKNIPSWLQILFTQSVTMILIGMWHGVNSNFLIWGVWNAIGLFATSLISRNNNTGKKIPQEADAIQKIGPSVIKSGFTFIFISLGWVWFAISDFNLAVSVFTTLTKIR